MSETSETDLDGKPRVEVFKMWFETRGDTAKDKWDAAMRLHVMRDLKYVKSRGKGNFPIIENDPTNFNGRIFLCDESRRFHEIYNSKTVATLYFDLPTKAMESKRKFHEDFVSGHDSSDVLKNNNNNNKSGHNNNTDLQAPEQTPLPVMGPHAGIDFSSEFSVIVRREEDSGDAFNTERLVEDNWKFWSDNFDPINERFLLKVGDVFHNLVLDCIVFNDSKSVHVEVKWVMDENNASSTHDTDIVLLICGELSFISEWGTSLLLKTPPNKAIKVSLGQSIPLLKSVFAVPYFAEFKIRAALARPDNVKEEYFPFYFPSVDDGTVVFSYEDIDTPLDAALLGNDDSKLYTASSINDDIDEDKVCSDFATPHDAAPVGNKHSKFYVCKKQIQGSGGHLEVTAIMDMQ